MERKNYPNRADDYELFETVGQGVSASVHRARCVPLDEIVAIKILDFERHNSDLNNISREAQTLLLINHPNVLNAHCSFVKDHELWVVMPFMAGGSCHHIMKSAYPNGFEEAVIATVLREVLRGLEYLHLQGHIHRDVKAGNILVDKQGGVKLGDFGVSAFLFDSGDRQRTRNTFVGTPCWMAPEVMEHRHGYDFKADIWSFGITALELAHGHAPFSKLAPMKVFIMTLNNAPPGLDYKTDKKFSRNFRKMVAMCLVKDPAKRPSASKLLKQSFFKQARSPDYIARKFLEGSPTLGDRYQALKEKEEDLLAQKKMPHGMKEELSQSEYKKGISNWNFDMEDLKAQAALITEDEDAPGKDAEDCQNSSSKLDTSHERMPEGPTIATGCCSKDDNDVKSNGYIQKKSGILSSSDQITCYQRSQPDGSDNGPKLACRNDQNNLLDGIQLHGSEVENHFGEHCKSEFDEKLQNGSSTNSFHERRDSTSSCSSDILHSERLKQQNQIQNAGNCNGGVSQTVNDIPIEAMHKASKSAASIAEDLDDKSKPPVVQQRGRFKVTSESVDLDKALPPLGLQKSHSMQVIFQASTSLPSPTDPTSNQHSTSVLQGLHCLLQTNILQRDNILNLMKQLSIGESSANRSAEGAPITMATILSEKSLLETANEREKELIQEITDLQWRLICLQEEIQRLKTKTAQV